MLGLGIRLWGLRRGPPGMGGSAASESLRHADHFGEITEMVGDQGVRSLEPRRIRVVAAPRGSWPGRPDPTARSHDDLSHRALPALANFDHFGDFNEMILRPLATAVARGAAET